MGWISRLFGGGPPPAGPATGARVGAQQPTEPVSVAPAPAPAAAPALAATPTAAPGPPLLCWLLDAAPPQPGLLPIERQALDAVDQVLAQPALPADLLPRAANVVPQLLALLRQQDLPVPVLADRIGRDPVLAAEVLRQAGGAYFAHLGPVNDLPQAIQRLGIEGLQMAIARVVLRPLYQARPGTLPAQTAPRLWEHAETLSRHASQQARAAGVTAFDGYLAGLLHDTGWTVLFHALQRGGISGLGALSVDGMAALDARAHLLFGRAAAGWQITPAFSAFAADAQRVELARSQDPLARVLQAAQGPCMAELAPG